MEENENNSTVVDNGSEENLEEQATHTAEVHNAEITDNGEQVEGNEGQTATHQTQEENQQNEDEDSVAQEVQEQRQAEEDAKAQVAKAGLDWDALSKEYEDNGSLSKESMNKLEKSGFPPSVVNAYIRGMEATANAYRDAVYNLAGGEEDYKQLTGFVAGLGQKEINTFNRAIDRGDLDELRNMFIGYKTRMVQKYGTSNRSILGGSAGGSTGGYANKSAMVKAMSDPRYGTDPEYTQSVQNKVMSSRFLNSN